MRLDRDGSLDAEHLHQLRHKENGVEKILLFPAWPFEDFNEATTERFQLRTRVADDERADSRAADDEHFVGQRMEDGTEMSARERKAAENHDDENDKTDGWKHGGGGPPNGPGAGGSSGITAQTARSL